MSKPDHDDLVEASKVLQEACSAFDDAGSDFEQMTEQLLLEFGFFNVRRQRAGSQHGRDFTADLDDPDGGLPTHWYIECKNLRGGIGSGEVAPKLIWHFSNERLTGGFVILGASRISNDLHEVLERTEFPFSIFDWTGNNFAKLVTLCPKTRTRWFPGLATSSGDMAAQWRSHLLHPATAGYEMRSPLRLGVVPRFNPPFANAYFQREGRFQVWPTDFCYWHYLSLFNACRSPLIVRSIRIRTIAYHPLPERLLVQFKAKGLFDPLRMKYTPSTVEGSEVEVLAPNMRRLVHRETEAHHIEMAGSPKPGCYELQVLITYDGNGREATTEGPILRVCVCTDWIKDAAGDPGNRLQVNVWRKHYDRLARRVLELPRDEWIRINASKTDDSIVFLGPTMHDDLHRRSTGWRIQSLPMRLLGKRADGASEWEFLDQPNVLFDLGDVPGEEPPRDPFEHNQQMSELYGVPIDQLYGSDPRLPGR